METQEYQGQIVGTLDSGEPRRVRVDSITNGMKTISSDHTSIHDGEMFTFSALITGVANDTTIAYAFKTPSVASGKTIHLKHSEFGSTAAKVRTDFYEAPTNTPAGSDLVAYNRNRVGTPTASAMQAIKANLVGLDLTGATMLENRQFINNRFSGMEWVLKPNTWYIRTFTNQTGASADIDFMEIWIEE